MGGQAPVLWGEQQGGQLVGGEEGRVPLVGSGKDAGFHLKRLGATRGSLLVLQGLQGDE